MERIPQFLIQKPFLFGGIAAVIDADELRKAEFAAVKKVELHTPGPHDQIRLRIRLRRTAQRQAETGHFEHHTPLAPVSAQRHQLTAHRIEPPQGVEPQRIAVHGFDGIFAAGTAAGRIGRYPVGSLRGSPVNALHGSPVGTLRGKQLRKEQNQNQQQSFHNRHVLGCNQSMSPTPNEKAWQSGPACCLNSGVTP